MLLVTAKSLHIYRNLKQDRIYRYDAAAIHQLQITKYSTYALEVSIILMY
jgi:hypothetical protein